MLVPCLSSMKMTREAANSCKNFIKLRDGLKCSRRSKPLPRIEKKVAQLRGTDLGNSAWITRQARQGDVMMANEDSITRCIY